jgi:formate hydrogenlyase transcriptional activator
MPRFAQREMIGESPRFRSVLDEVAMVAPADCAVLIQGETGTGKELIARAVHEQSLRAAGPFVTVNCAALPAGLLESELFGHERGAFTGALTQRLGRLQLAHRGTIFLDEIGELPLELQPKLLRALQEKEFERLGGSQTIRVDVRIVAATNQGLAEMVNARRFRADLYYRLNVFPIMLPALRERTEDIPPLVRHFVREFAGRMNKEIAGIPEYVMERLRLHDWPGNIRELQNFIERAVLLTDGLLLDAPVRDLTRRTEATPDLPDRTLAEFERVHIAETLRKTNWVVGGRAGAAAKLGLPRTTLIARMRKLGIERSAPEVFDGNSRASGGAAWREMAQSAGVTGRSANQRGPAGSGLTSPLAAHSAPRVNSWMNPGWVIASRSCPSVVMTTRPCPNGMVQTIGSSLDVLEEPPMGSSYAVARTCTFGFRSIL